MRYIVRSLVGLRPKKRILAVYREADQRQRLYKALQLYEIDDGEKDAADKAFQE